MRATSVTTFSSARPVVCKILALTSLDIAAILSVLIAGSVQAQVPFPTLPTGTNGNATNSTSTVRTLSISTGSNFSPNASATSSPGVPAVSEGSVGFSGQQSINSSVSCQTSACQGSWDSSKTSSGTLDIVKFQGADAGIKLELGPTSKFNSSVDTTPAKQAITNNTGTASAGFNANTSLSVSSQESSFSNTLINAF